MSRESRAGWIGSVAFHVALAIVLIVVTVPEIVANEELVELSWGAELATETKAESPPQAASSSRQGETALQPLPRTNQKASQPVVLPERRVADVSGEALPMPRTEKLDVPQAGAVRTPATREALGEREKEPGKGVGEREQFTPNPSSGVSPTGGLAPGSGSLDAVVGRGVGFSIQWTGGGTRKKVSGDLPEYPAGANVEAQIKVMAVVESDGTIKIVQPIQKGDTRLEDAAMRAVRLWRFEPLRASQSQLSQNCVITFLFKLK
jgi:TonB family protein